MKRANSSLRPPLRWWWLGLCLAAILWLGSDIYYQRIQSFDEIEYLSDDFTPNEITQQNEHRAKNHRRCQYTSIAIAIGSFAYLGRQLTRKINKSSTPAQ